MSGIICIGMVGSLVLTPMVFQLGLGFRNSSLYIPYMILSEIVLHMFTAIHIAISCIVVHFRTNKWKDSEPKKYFTKWTLEHDIFRYAAAVLLALFSIYANIANLVAPNDVSSQSYNTLTQGIHLALDYPSRSLHFDGEY
jgi:hypothetical protein